MLLMIYLIFNDEENKLTDSVYMEDDGKYSCAQIEK